MLSLAAEIRKHSLTRPHHDLCYGTLFKLVEDLGEDRKEGLGRWEMRKGSRLVDGGKGGVEVAG